MSTRHRLTAEEKLKTRKHTHTSTKLDYTQFGVRELGRFLPKELQARREGQVEKQVEDRQAIRRAAMFEATVTVRRDAIARKLYHGEGVGIEDWPASRELTPQERTIILRDLRQIFGVPEKPRPVWSLK